MKHIDEDDIYKFALEFLGDEESKLIDDHIEQCGICRKKLLEIEAEFKIISSYDPHVESTMPSLPKKRSLGIVWLKRAAIIIVGFFIGYMSSNYIGKKDVIVVGQSFTPKNNLSDSLQLFFCESIDIKGYNFNNN